MSEDVWSEQDTNPDAIEAALRELLRERHAADRALAPARVLNLIVVVDAGWKEDVSERLKLVGRYHASRTVLCSVERGRGTLDAVATIAYDAGGNGSVRPMRERVEVDLGPEMLGGLDTIVDPVLVSELPTMLWSPHGHREAVQALLPLTDVMLLDSDIDGSDSGSCLGRADELRRSVYVVDLAWLRTIPWRERLASSFDLPYRASGLSELNRVCVRHHPDSLACATLLAGWLASRLGWETTPLRPENGDGSRGNARDGGREITIELVAVDQDVPGLAGVTVAWGEGHSLSLDRGPGGLRAIERRAESDQERSWQVLGASRGEAGILGEGVRQALLRDSTYSAALEHALLLRGPAPSA